MKKQKNLCHRIGLFLSLVLFLLSTTSICIIVFSSNNLNLLIPYMIMLILALSLYLLRNSSYGGLIQVVSLIITSIMTILTDPNIGYFILQVVIIYLLAEKYGYLKRKVILKSVISLVVIALLMVISFITIERETHYIVSSLVFYFIFIMAFYIIKLDDMKSYLESIRLLKGEITALNSELLERDKILEVLEPEYIDPIESGLTNAELQLLEALCLYKETNLQLSHRLNKSENTVKTQLKSISQKIGVDNRHQLIDACRGYFYVLKI